MPSSVRCACPRRRNPQTVSDPLRLPSDTRYHFMVVVVLVATVLIFTAVSLSVIGHREEFAQCQDRASRLQPAVVTAVDQLQWRRVYHECLQATHRTIGGSALAWFLGSWVLVGAYYVGPAGRGFSSRADRRHKPMGNLYPEIRDEITRLAEKVGIGTSMTFMMDLRHGAPLRVLGRQRVPRLVLSHGARKDYYQNRGRFAARILHEFAHLIHKDVRQYYFALAAVRTAMMCGLLMSVGVVVVVWASGESISTAFAFSWRMAALFGLSFLALRDFLRSREVFADLRTARWLGDTAPLQAALATLRADETSPPGGPGGSFKDRLRRLAGPAAVPAALFRTHPSVQSRLDALEDPWAMLRVRLSTVFGAGIVAAILASSLTFMLEMLGSGRWWEPYVTELSGGVASAFLTLLLAAGVRRDVHLHRIGRVPARAPTTRRAATMAITVTAGLVLGKLLALDAIYDRTSAWPPHILGVMATAVTVFVLLVWLYAGARLLFSAAEPTHAAHRVLLGSTVLVGAAVLAQTHKFDAVLDVLATMRRGAEDVPGLPASRLPSAAGVLELHLGKLIGNPLTWVVIALAIWIPVRLHRFNALRATTLVTAGPSVGALVPDAGRAENEQTATRSTPATPARPVEPGSAEPPAEERPPGPLTPTRPEMTAVLAIAVVAGCWTLVARGCTASSAAIVGSFMTAALCTWQAHRGKPLMTPPVLAGYVWIVLCLIFQARNAHFGADEVTGLATWTTLVCVVPVVRNWSSTGSRNPHVLALMGGLAAAHGMAVLLTAVGAAPLIAGLLWILGKRTGTSEMALIAGTAVALLAIPHT